MAAELSSRYLLQHTGLLTCILVLFAINQQPCLADSGPANFDTIYKQLAKQNESAKQMKCVRRVFQVYPFKTSINSAIFLGPQEDIDLTSAATPFNSVRVLPESRHCSELVFRGATVTNLWLVSQNVSSFMDCFKSIEKSTLEKLVKRVDRIMLVLMGDGMEHEQLEVEIAKLTSFLGGTDKVQCIQHHVSLKDKNNARSRDIKGHCQLVYACPYCCKEGLNCVDTAFMPHDGPLPSVVSEPHNWQFKGAKLKTAYMMSFKNWYQVGKNPRDGSPVMDGSDYRLVKILAEHFNFTLEVQPGNNPPGTELPNGSWTGIMGLVTRQEVDFTLTSLGLTFEREKDVDFTPAYDYSGFYVLQAKPRRKINPYAIVTPFETAVWVAIGLVSVATEIVVIVVRAVNRRRNVLPSGLNEFTLFQIAFSQEKDSLRASNKRKKTSYAHETMLTFTIIVLMTFLGMFYSAVYYTHMVKPEYTKPIETVTDLIASENTRWISYRGTILETAANFLPLGEKALYRQTGPGDESDNDYIKNNPDVVMALDRNPNGNGGLGNPRTKDDFENGVFYLGREPLIDYWKALAVPTNSPLLKKFSPVILRLYQTGVCERNEATVQAENGLTRFSYKALRETQNKEIKSRPPAPLTMLGNLHGAFVVFSVGIGVSIAAFIGEILVARFQERNMRRAAVTTIQLTPRILRGIPG